MGTSNIDNLNIENDLNVNIFQYLETQNVEIIIKDIQCGNDINVVIEQFLTRTADYNKIKEKIDLIREKIASCHIDIHKNALLKDLDDLLEVEKRYKIETIRLADLFTNVTENSNRLDSAKVAFLNGDFNKVKEILKFDKDDLEYESLIYQEKKFEKHDNDKKILSSEYLIRARVLLIEWRKLSNNDNDICICFKRSIKLNSTVENLSAYANFLLRTRKIVKAKEKYQLAIGKEYNESNTYMFSIRANSKLNLGVLLKNEREFEIAKKWMESAINDYKILVKRNWLNYSYGLASAYHNLANLLSINKKFRAASRQYKNSEKIIESLIKTDLKYLFNLCLVLKDHANSSFGRGRIKLAQQLYSKSLDSYNAYYEIFGNKDSQVLIEIGNILYSYGTFLYHQNDFKSAEELYAQALKFANYIYQYKQYISASLLARIYNGFGNLYFVSKNYEESLKMYREAKNVLMQNNDNLNQYEKLVYVEIDTNLTSLLNEMNNKNATNNG